MKGLVLKQNSKEIFTINSKIITLENIMHSAGFNVIVGSFEKNENTYYATITCPLQNNKEKTGPITYKVLLSSPGKSTVSCTIKQDDSGCWIPDKRRAIDPWIADSIGRIIEEKILKNK